MKCFNEKIALACISLLTSMSLRGRDMTSVLKIFGKNLVRLMKIRRMTGLELSEKMGDHLGKIVSPSMVSNWRSGKHIPTAKHLDTMCKILRCSAFELFIDSSSNPSLSDLTGDDALEALAQSMGYAIYPISDKKKK